MNKHSNRHNSSMHSSNLNYMYDEIPLPHGGTGRQQHWAMQLRKYFMKSDLKDKKILDAGCGTGTVTKHLTNYSDNVFACDISPSSIKIAKGYAPKAKYKLGNVLGLDYKDASFDAVICIGVIHHTNNAYKAFQELVRVTKPGGKILLFVYNKMHPYYLIYNLSRLFLKNKKIQDIPKPLVKLFGMLVSVFYKEDISFDDAQHWFSDILLTPIAHHYTLGTVKKWSRLNSCKVLKVGYTLLRMNLLTLIQKE